MHPLLLCDDEQYASVMGIKTEGRKSYFKYGRQEEIPYHPMPTDQSVPIILSEFMLQPEWDREIMQYQRGDRATPLKFTSRPGAKSEEAHEVSFRKYFLDMQYGFQLPNIYGSNELIKQAPRKNLIRLMSDSYEALS